MSLRVEWFSGPFSTMSIVPGDAPVGEFAVDPGNVGLVFQGDEAAVFEGPPDRLRALLLGALADLDALHPPRD